MSDSTYLDELKRLYDEGDKSRLLAAIRFCGKYKLIMPDWVVNEFRTGTDPWFKYEVKELGEALGVGRKGVHLAAEKKKHKLKYKVYNKITDAKFADKKKPIEELFVEIGKELHLGKTLVSEYYYEAKSYLEPDFRKK